MLEKHGEIQKTNQSHPKFDSELQLGEQVGEGSETKVFESRLKYKEQKIVHGLVYKKIRHSDLQPEFGRMEVRDRLRKWDRIKSIKRTLSQNGEMGFNIPGTIRGYKDGEGAGIIMTDLTEGGRKDVLDFKDMTLRHEAQVDPEEWRKIRDAIICDVDIAIKNGVDLCGGPFPLDPWVLVYDPQQNKYDVYLVDIGGYVHMYNSSENTQVFLQKSREKVIDALNKLESKILILE